MKMVLCPRCGGSPDLDEDGRFYACYFCCNEGEVPEDVALAEARDSAWAWYVAREADIKRRAEPRVPYGWSYYVDDYDGAVVMVPPRVSAARAKPVANDVFDDIPF